MHALETYASPPTSLAWIARAFTFSRPRDKHKVTLRRGFLQAPHPFSVFVKSHMRTQTRLGNRFVCCRPGAQAPRLQVSAHAMPMSMNQKASRVRPSPLQARPRGCVLVNLSMKTDTRLDENRFVRCSSGSPSTLFTMTCYRQLRICIFTTSLATSLASSCRSASPGVFFSQRLPARTRLAPPLLRPTPPSRLVSRKSACLVRIWEGLGEALGCFLCLPCTPTRGLRCLLSLGFVCHGVDRIW